MEKENAAPSGSGDKTEQEQSKPVASSEPTPASTSESGTAPAPATTAAAPKAAVEDDEESDWEDLDDVLDDFSAAKQGAKTDKKEAQAPTSATTDTTATAAAGAVSSQPQDDNGTGIDEEAFLKQLEAGMAEMVGGAGAPRAGGPGEEGLPPGMADQWSELEKQLEASGMQPEDLLKQLMGDMLNLGGEGGGSGAGEGSGAAAPASAGTSSSQPADLGGNKSSGGGDEDFQTKIQRTMERMQTSGERATTAAQGDDGDKGVGDEVLEKMLKAMEAGVGEGNEPDLMKLFMDMMEDLSHKEMLYEPMKELHTKFGPWLRDNKGKVEKEEMERYELQAKIVEEIVNKFDEPGYSDQNPEDKAYIWERMQKMQDAGNPPDELISNPATEDMKNQLAEGAACPQQ